MYLKRIAVPKTWPVERKSTKLITAPLPGVAKELGIPVNVVLKEILKVASTSREVRAAVRAGRVLVDGKPRGPRFMIGLMDVLSVGEEAYRMMLNRKGKLELLPIGREEAALKPCRIMGKTLLKGGKVQYNLHDGGNWAGEGGYRVGDALVMSLPERKVVQHVPFEKKSTVYLMGGAHIGEGCVVESIKKGKLRCRAGETLLETLPRFAFVVGKESPLITLPQ